jgi:hypothetical protein
MTHNTANDTALSAWRHAASQLASWAESRLVNRRDVWGVYIQPSRRRDPQHKSYTAPARQNRGRVVLTREVLRDHFAGHRVVGLHASDGAASRWFAFDFDCHMGDDATRLENLAACERLVESLRARGLEPLVEDSDGRGGMHAWVLLDAPAATADVFALAHELRSSLQLQAETFPKQPVIGAGKCGNWLRLPGVHHTRPHVSRILAADGAWWDGPDAVRALLAAPVSPASRIPKAPPSRLTRVGGSPIECDSRDRRLLAYVAKVDHGLSDGRKRVAFRLGAAFLHDFALSKSQALSLLGAWNAQNLPALDGSILAEILENAGRYGRGGRAA